jgi:hypothetical protein
MIFGKATIQLAATALLLSLTIPAQAQSAKKVPRIGYLRFIEFPAYDAAFRNGLSDLMWNIGLPAAALRAWPNLPPSW